MKQTLRVLTVAAGIIATSSAFAAQDTATMNVQILVDVTCDIQTVPSPARSSTSGEGGTGQTYQGDVEVLCGPGVNYNLTMDAGQAYNGSWRQVSDGLGNTFTYGLFDEFSAEWGDSAGANTYPYGPGRTGTGDGNPQLFPVYLEAFVGMVPAGTYTDAVLVTLTF